MLRSVELAKTCYSQSVLRCFKNLLTWCLETSMVPHGDDSQAMNNGTTALLRKPLPARTYQFHRAPTPLWGPGGVPGEWTDVCGFIKPPGFETEWHIRNGVFEIPNDILLCQAWPLSTSGNISRLVVALGVCGPPRLPPLCCLRLAGV